MLWLGFPSTGLSIPFPPFLLNTLLAKCDHKIKWFLIQAGKIVDFNCLHLFFAIFLCGGDFSSPLVKMTKKPPTVHLNSLLA